MVEANIPKTNPTVLEPVSQKAVKGYKWKIYWPNCVALFILHVAAIYALTLKKESMLSTELFARFMVLLTGIGITAGAHRLWAHRSYKATTLGQIILMFLASLTYQNSIYTWCRDHRMHHKYSETDADPHNAKRGFFYSHVGWLLVRKHRDFKSKTNTVDLSDLEANPIVMFQHKYYFPIVFVCTFCISTFAPWYFWGESLKIAFFRTTILRNVFILHVTWTVNSVAHMFGNKPYDRTIGPVENKIVQIISQGEGFHNYHHTFPWDYKASEFGASSRNVTTWYIDFLAWLGLAYDRKTVEPDGVKKRLQRTGDGTMNTHESYLRKYLPKQIDSYLWNTFNVLLFLAILYIP